MKRIFGTNTVTNTTQTSVTQAAAAIDTQALVKIANNDVGNNHTAVDGSTPGIVPATKASMYARTSHGNPSISTTPRTPLGSSSTTGQYEYFPPTMPLSPSSSVRQAHIPAFNHATLSSPSLRTMSGPGLLTPVQNIAHPLSRQPTTIAQPGAAPAISDSTASITNQQAHSLDRGDLHKGVKSLEGLLVTLDEYKDLKVRLGKCEKRLTKSLDEMAKSKAFEQVPSKTLQAVSSVFEAKAEVSLKQAKMVQKEYDAVNEHCAKYFKRIAKEERVFDEQLDALDSKIKKANASHDKGAKKNSKSALESHDRFIQTMQALTNDVARLKATHSSSVGTKTFATSLMVTATMGGLADAEFKALCESVRRSGQHIGSLHEWLNFTVTEAMANCQPPDLGEDGAGLGQRIAVKEGEIREELRKQEHARFKQLEEEHAMLKLQQLGWTPPALQRQGTVLSVVDRKEEEGAKKENAIGNLPRLDSNGNLVDVANPSPKPKLDKGEEKWVKTASHHQAASSTAEGTVIIKECDSDKFAVRNAEVIEEEPEEEADRDAACTPGLSSGSSGASSSALSSSALVGPNEVNKKSSEDSSPLPFDAKSLAPLTPIEEQCDRVIVKPDSFEEDDREIKLSKKIADWKSSPVAEKRYSQQTQDPLPPGDRQPTSVWGRGPEHDRQLELEKRLAEAENRLRMMQRAETADAYVDRRQMPVSNAQPGSRPRHSEPTYGVNEARPSSRADAVQYSPAVRQDYGYSGEKAIRNGEGGQGVSRSLSTDSERSFVARMRAIYQADKADSQQRDSQNERRAGGQAGNGNERYFNVELSPPSRARHDSAPSYPHSVPRSKASNDPPHAKSCGCWNCSARHYRTADTPTTGASISMAQTKAGIVPPTPPPRHPAATMSSREQALLAQHRRQTVQILPDEHMYARDGGRDSGLIAPSHQLYGRRSFEDEPQRRPAYNKENAYGTVR